MNKVSQFITDNQTQVPVIKGMYSKLYDVNLTLSSISSEPEPLGKHEVSCCDFNTTLRESKGTYVGASCLLLKPVYKVLLQGT